MASLVAISEKGGLQFLVQIAPFLVGKMDQAEVALKFAATVQKSGKRIKIEDIPFREACCAQIKALKQPDFDDQWLQLKAAKQRSS